MATPVSQFVLPITSSGWFNVSYAILADGRLARLQASEDMHAAFRARVAGDYDTPYPPKATARIMLFDGIAEELACIFPLEYPCPTFDRLPDGHWVVANSRCDWKEANARLLSPDGTLIRRFLLGDGIEHIQCDDQGFIWVGYFDEGIFGAAEAEPVGAAGLVKFDDHGLKVWEHDGRAAVITDCSALNVHGSDVWCCFDSPLDGRHSCPVVHLSGDDVELWRTPLFLVGAIAACGPLVAVAAIDLDRSSQIQLLRLDDGTATVMGTFTLAALGLGSQGWDVVIGRGETLHVIRRDSWFKLTPDRLAYALATDI